MRLGCALVAALILSSAPGSSPGADFHSSGWLAADQPRPAPETVYAGKDCAPAGPAVCRRKAWTDLLASRGEGQLVAPPGGRSYRLMIDAFFIGLGLQLTRLDIDAAGMGTVTSSYGSRRVTVHPVSAETIAAFDAAVAQSGFEAAGATPMRYGCVDGDQSVFEAAAGGRYKFVVQPCGDEAGLAKAIAVLNAL